MNASCWKSLASAAVVASGIQLVTPGANREHEKTKESRINYKIKLAERVVKKFKEERGVPGVSVGVSVNGKVVWRRGFGYSDVENLTRCSGNTVMRIASISKCITMALAAKLLEEGKLDLDAPVQKYVPSFPEKLVDGEKVTLTTRHLVSHLGGVRHYDKSKPKKEEDKTEQNVKLASDQPTVTSADDKATQTQEKKSEFQWSEYYSQKQYKSVTEALDMFKNDPLISKPGTTFYYTTHGWTLVSAVLENAGGKKFEDMLKDMLKNFAMNETYLDENTPLIADRAKYYHRSRQTGRLENVRWVNNSYKWAGGGLLSTVGDLLTFADVLVQSYSEDSTMIRYLKKQTVIQMWTPVKNTSCSWIPKRGYYAMGWCVDPTPRITEQKPTQDPPTLADQFYVSHTGGAIGASSVLLIKPAQASKKPTISVAVLTNLQECGGLNKLALDIAAAFENNE